MKRKGLMKYQTTEFRNMSAPTVIFFFFFFFFFFCNKLQFGSVVKYIQYTLVISTLLIENCLSRSENLVSVFNMEILQQVTKYRGKDEKLLLLFSTMFLKYFYIQKSNYIFICDIWLFHFPFPQFCKSDMSKNAYLEVFQRVPWTSR